MPDVTTHLERVRSTRVGRDVYADQYAAAVVRARAAGASVADIAEAAGCSVQAVSQLLGRAQARAAVSKTPAEGGER
jgi:DNA-directed RNA polymerase specialized sigma24 family protein